MALICFDGFDYTTNSNFLNSLGYYDTGGAAIIAGGGRFGGNCLSIAPAYPGSPTRVFAAGFAQAFVGFAVNAAVNTLTVGFVDTNNNSNYQCYLTFNDYGQISAYNGNGTLLGSSSINAWLPGTWCYCEIKPVIAGGTSGSLQVRINGAVVLTLPNVNTQHPTSTSSTFNGIRWAAGDYANPRIDDFYMCDPTGAAPYNSYLGNVRVQAVLPAAAGSLTQFLKSSTSLANWQCAINQNVDDTLYVYSATVGNEDLYTVSASIGAVTIYGVQIRGAYRQDDATQRSAQTLLKSGSTFATTAVVPCNQAYAFQTDGPFIVDPNTGASWTPSAVNSLQIGPKVAA